MLFHQKQMLISIQGYLLLEYACYQQYLGVYKLYQSKEQLHKLYHHYLIQ
nr:MAG TPA: hypothetical protein [Bacteriophage sp.]